MSLANDVAHIRPARPHEFDEKADSVGLLTSAVIDHIEAATGIRSHGPKSQIASPYVVGESSTA